MPNLAKLLNDEEWEVKEQSTGYAMNSKTDDGRQRTVIDNIVIKIINMDFHEVRSLAPPMFLEKILASSLGAEIQPYLPTLVKV